MKFSLFSLSLTSWRKVLAIFSSSFFSSFHFAPVRHFSASSLTRTLFTYFSEPGVIARTLAANSTQDDLVLIPPIKVERFHQFCLSISRDLNPDGSTSVISIFFAEPFAQNVNWMASSVNFEFILIMFYTFPSVSPPRFPYRKRWLLSTCNFYLIFISNLYKKKNLRRDFVLFLL